MEDVCISRRARALVVLISLLSFALGYTWGHGNSVAPIIIEKCSDA